MSDEPLKNLLKIPLEGGKPEPGKVSEMVLEFADPLMTVDPDGPPNIGALRSIMQIAEMCWNLPVLENSEASSYAQAKRTFDDALAAMPGGLSKILRQLIEDRKVRFGAVPFFVNVRVDGEDLENARVVVEARMPSTEAKN